MRVSINLLEKQATTARNALFGALLGLVFGCEKEDTWAPEAQIWPEMPLSLYVLGDSDLREATEEATEVLNGRVGCAISRVIDRNDVAQVLVRRGDGAVCGGNFTGAVEVGADIAGAAYLCPAGSAFVAEIHVGNVPNVWAQLYVVHHELGHVFGLADDRSGRAARWAMGPLPDSSDSLPPLRLSDADAAALEKRYCK